MKTNKVYRKRFLVVLMIFAMIFTSGFLSFATLLTTSGTVDNGLIDDIIGDETDDNEEMLDDIDPVRGMYPVRSIGQPEAEQLSGHKNPPGI